MSASTGTKIFGVRLGVDPKVLIGGLLLLAGIVFWFNSRGDEVPSTPVSAPRGDIAPVAIAPMSARSKSVRRNRLAAPDRGILRIRPVDATRGDIDPTLRLDLLARLQSVRQAKAGRSLFEIGPASGDTADGAMPAVPKTGPTIPVVSPQPSQAEQSQASQVNIPLKFYGFVRPAAKGQYNRGLFLDGDNILVASEGELINHRYLVRELNAANARLEDTQMKQGQTLPVVPEAIQQ
jgi:hypothetical protein